MKNNALEHIIFYLQIQKTLLYLHRSKLKYYAEHTEATPIGKQSHISRLCSDRFFPTDGN